MKILAVHNGGVDANKASMIDIWRVWRPIRELRKHVDWQIDEQETYIPGFKRNKDKENFTEKEVEQAIEQLGKYDVVWGSYHFSPMTFALCQIVTKHYGTQFVLDGDDDFYNIKEDNFGWWTKVTKEETRHVQTMYELSPWVTTSTEYLAEQFRTKRPGHHKDTVIVLPNYVSRDYKHPKFDNGDKVVIGYFGGASHYYDLHSTGFPEALEKLMHENKNIHFVTAGMMLEKYVPKGRYTYIEGERGHGWYKNAFGKLNYDISVAPLEDNEFAQSKSDIKWQESAMIPAAFLASRVGPYKALNPKLGRTTPNTTEDWYKSLKQLVEDVEYRNSLRDNANSYVKENLLIENNWQHIKDMFEKVYEAKK
jgi:glycosyltransferase involved in cell wall biosynthesis